MRCCRLALLTSAFALIAVPATAAERHTTPTATATSPCTSSQPCAIDAAINDALAGDEVIVAPGTYEITTPLAPEAAIDIHGVDGGPRPRLTGLTNLGGTTLTLEHGETVSHLEIRATSSTHNALQIKGDGAHAERLVVWGRTAHAAKLVPSGSTVLRSSLVETAGGGEDVSALKLMDGAPGETMEISNVTAWASQGEAIGIRCEAVKSTTTITNTVARGAESDIDAANAGSQCDVENSNFRPARSPGVSGAANQDGDPALTDPAGNDFYPTAASPLVDAGTSSGSLGSTDLAGRGRVLGGDPDIGAYERDGAATVADPASAGPLTPTDLGQDRTAVAEQPTTPPNASAPALPAAPAILLAQPRGLSELPTGVTPPVLGRTAVVAPAKGVVKVKVAGKRTFVTLKAGDDIPMNSVVDARAGAVRLSTATSAGFQTATFSGGQFEVRQLRTQRGMTDILLRGGDFSRCPKATKARAAGKRKPIRSLWGSDRNGRFRTHGSASVATVRGTRWLTEDHCHGTLTRVTEGAVDVKDRRTGKTTRVRAGAKKLIRRIP